MQRKISDRMWEFWTPLGGSASPCLVCMKVPAVAMHHITPRSVNRVEDPWDLIPTCDECHREVDGDASRRPELREKVVRRAQSISEWKGEEPDRVLFKHGITDAPAEG